MVPRFKRRSKAAKLILLVHGVCLLSAEKRRIEPFIVSTTAECFVSSYLHVKYVSINYANYRFYLKVTLLLAKKCFFFVCLDFLPPPAVLFMFASCFYLFPQADLWEVAKASINSYQEDSQLLNPKIQSQLRQKKITLLGS